MSTGSERPSGFINLTIPSQLDRYLDTLVSQGVDRYYFPQKKMVWQAAVEHWLKARPDLKHGIGYLGSRATSSVHGATDFVQRRVQLGEILEQQVRALSVEMADKRHKPFPLARIIFTAVDYYCRHVATPENALHKNKRLAGSLAFSNDVDRSDTKHIRLQLNLKRTDPARIIEFIREFAGESAEMSLTVRVDQETANNLLRELIGNRHIDQHEFISELTKRLIQIGK